MKCIQGSTRGISHSYFSARQQFFNEVKTVVGNLHDAQLPAEIQILSQQLVNAGESFVQLRSETLFVELCQQTIKRCNQTWGLLSFWVSSEQSCCYALYWCLKAALQQYEKEIAILDAEQKNQLDLFANQDNDLRESSAKNSTLDMNMYSMQQYGSF